MAQEISLENYSLIAESLLEKGWCVVENFLDSAMLGILRQEMETFWRENRFRKAGIGPKTNLQFIPQVRQDHVCWVEETALTTGQKYYWGELEKIRHEINRLLFLGLFEFEGHLTIYPPGAFYRKHLDQFHYARERTVSCVLYLNREWTTEKGGALRMYLDGVEGAYQDVYPHFGAVVFFLSARFYHEVLPATDHRYSVTGWFKTRRIIP